jgi:hypothetical protein
MAFNVKNEMDRARLYDCVKTSYDNRDFYRKKRKTYIAQFTGHHYTRETAKADEQTIVPTMYEMVETFVQKLVANNPRITSETEITWLKSFARRFGLAVNKRLAQIKFECSLQDTVLDACFGMGWMKIHNGESYPLDYGGDYGVINPGLPTACNTSDDDVFWDSTAARYGECRFVGDFYRVSLDALQDDNEIPLKVKQRLMPMYNNEAERDGQKLSRSMSQGNGATAEFLTPMVELMDVFLCHERRVVTLVKDQPSMPPLRVAKWTGCEQGPYRYLSLTKVPGQIQALAPAMVLTSLHRIVNMCWLKNADQADRQKTVYGYPPSGVKDAERHKQAVDGEYIQMQNVDNVKIFSNGGPDGQTGAFAISALHAFKEGAGNLDTMAGLGPQADTYGQEKLLYGAASQREAKMLQQVLGFTADVVRDLGFLMFQDEFLEMDNYHEGPNKKLRVPYPWQPGLREGSFDQYTLRVEPYSMMYVNPSQKFQGICDYLVNIRAVLMQFGDAIAIEEVDEMAAEYLDAPRLREICRSRGSLDPNNFPGTLMGDGPKAGKPNGQYTRRSVSSPGAPQAQDKMVQAAMLGNAPANGNMPGVRSA